VIAHALIPAAGRGERYGGRRPKQLQEIGGRTLVAWAVERLRRAGVAHFVVALPDSELAAGAGPLGLDEGVVTVAGGRSRQESVARCLAACQAGAEELVLVHDAARAAIDPADVRAVVAACRRADGAVLGRPVTDTLKRLDGEQIAATEERRGLFRAETPQAFRRQVLETALAQAAADGFVGTDESSLVERLPGVRIVAVTASRPNPKLTWEGDRELMAALLLSSAHRPPPETAA
jgi:2-C-methyl-D-erythritol 4-phosphate cytidylyltransferase